MALMFPRLARNFIKNGYFPTDEVTLERILAALDPADAGEMRLLDPCAGEGVALAECKAYLGERAQAFGIEYDAERAWHAKELLDRCIHGSFLDCQVSKRSFGLVFLNPPYGDLVADKGQTGEGKGKQRMEWQFYRASLELLQFGGVMVLIVPYYVLTPEFAEAIASHFDQVKAFRAPEERFKQAVIFGVRKRTAETTRRADTKALLVALGQGEYTTVLPEGDWACPYVVPAAPKAEFTFTFGGMDPAQLAGEIHRYPCLWDQFTLRFGQVVTTHRRPLRRLSEWHLALALAAGQVSGVVEAKDGRVFVLKGDTHKEKAVSVTQEADDKGRTSEVRVHLDRFVPVIRALDFTPGSPSFGQALTIR